MKIAIVTSLCGNIDKLHTPKTYFPNADYFAFTDQLSNNVFWKQMPIYKFSQDEKYANRRNAKLYKILPELFIPDYDYYIYYDPSHEVIKDPEWIINEYMKDNDIAVFKHNERDCIYDEAVKLIEWKYDHAILIDDWYKHLKRISYPSNNGLYELPAFIKNNSAEMLEMSLMWWEIICKYSSRDQLSLPYVLWKMNIKPAILPGFANGYNAQGKIGNNPIIPQVYSKKR